MDLEEWLRRNQEGGFVIMGKKIYMLAYADDMTLLAIDLREMQSMLICLERYLKKKKLILNLKKSKMQIFKKGGKRAKQEKWNWNWKGQEVEVVKCFKYLGYIMQSNNGNSEHIKYICKKARMGMGAVWGIGKRLFKNELGKRLKLFNANTEAILMYGVEVWGWREEAELQELLMKYWKWMLGVRWNTPTCLIQEEVKEENVEQNVVESAFVYKKSVSIGRRLLEEGLCEMES